MIFVSLAFVALALYHFFRAAAVVWVMLYDAWTQTENEGDWKRAASFSLKGFLSLMVGELAYRIGEAS